MSTLRRLRPSAALVVAFVGTDQHPFDRLVGWLDDLAWHNLDADVVVQYGYSTPPVVATGYDFLTMEKVTHLLEMADVVVCHGGPGTILDAHRAGRRPILVPRDPEHGEHVDEHQLRFAATIERTKSVRVARDQQTFETLIEDWLVPGGRLAARIPRQRRPPGLPALARELDAIPRQVKRREPVLRTLRQVLP